MSRFNICASAAFHSFTIGWNTIRDTIIFAEILQDGKMACGSSARSVHMKCRGATMISSCEQLTSEYAGACSCRSLGYNVASA